MSQEKPEGVLEQILFTLKECQNHLTILLNAKELQPDITEVKDIPTAKRGRPKKQEEPVNKVQEEPVNKVQEEPVSKVQTVEPSLDDTRDAMKKYIDVEGHDAAIALLEEFGAKRVSEIEPTDRSKFMTRCYV